MFKARGSIVALKVWLDRESPCLPSDSCPTNPTRQLLTDACPTNPRLSLARVPTQPSPERCVHRPLSRFVMVSRFYRGLFQVIVKVRPSSVHAVTRCTLLASLLFFFLSSHVVVHSSCQVLNSSTVPYFTQFCTRVAVHNLLRQVSVSVCFAHHRWSVEYQSCKFCNAVLLKHRLAWFQHLHNFFAEGTFSILTYLCLVLVLAHENIVYQMCLGLVLGHNQCVNKFAVELSLWISTLNSQIHVNRSQG